MCISLIISGIKLSVRVLMHAVAVKSVLKEFEVGGRRCVSDL